MLVKLVRSQTIKKGDKLLRGNRVVTIEDIIRPYKKHFILVANDDLIFCKDGMNVLKVIPEMSV